jgi:phospholipid/cholesterol/gamma-HCH transport system permease protein
VTPAEKQLPRSERALENLGSLTGGMAFLFARSIKEFTGFVLRPKQYLLLTVEQLFYQGARSIPFTMVVGAATGVVFALQLGYGLKRFGGALYVPQVVGMAMFRELGPTLTCLCLAGRIGSGLSSELSSMTVTEQVDAIRAFGTSPVSTLVVPRILACVIAVPILVLLADYVAIFCSMMISKHEFMIDPAYYISKTISYVHFEDLATGLFKSLVFGFFIALIGCYKGLTTQGGTRGVGISTTSVVVMSSTIILISDVILSRLFIVLGFYY